MTVRRWIATGMACVLLTLPTAGFSPDSLGRQVGKTVASDQLWIGPAAHVCESALTH